MNFRSNHRMNFGARKPAPDWLPWLGVILLTAFIVGMLSACATKTVNPDGTVTDDPPQVAMGKRVKQAQFILDVTSGALSANSAPSCLEGTEGCLSAAKAAEYQGYIAQARDALGLVTSGGDVLPCFAAATCTDAQMQQAGIAIGKVFGLIAKITIPKKA